MGQTFSAEFGRMEGFRATHHAAGEMITTAGAADPADMLASVAMAIGAIGVSAYLPALVPALGSALAGATRVSDLHHAISHATQAAKVAIIASDNA
jgi:hypothetical protein